MSLFSNPYAALATLSLILQIIVLALLTYGYWLKRKLKFPQHGRTMALAVALHLVFIFLFMIPVFAFVIVPQQVFLRSAGAASIVSLLHVPFGVLAVALGLWLVLAWRSTGLKGCFKRKKIMLATMVLWVAALIAGITLFTILYWSILIG